MLDNPAPEDGQGSIEPDRPEYSPAILHFIFITELVIGIPAMLAFSAYLYFFRFQFIQQESSLLIASWQTFAYAIYYLLPGLSGVLAGMLSFRYLRIAMLMFFISNAYALVISLPELLWAFLNLLEPDTSQFAMYTLVIQASRFLYALIMLGFWQHYRGVAQPHWHTAKFMPAIYLTDLLACVIGTSLHIFLSWQFTAAEAGEATGWQIFMQSFYQNSSIWSFFWDFLWVAVWMLVRALIAYLSYLRVPAMILFCVSVAISQTIAALINLSFGVEIFAELDTVLQSLIRMQSYLYAVAIVYNLFLVLLILISERKLLLTFLIRVRE